MGRNCLHLIGPEWKPIPSPIAVLEQQCDELNEYVLNHGRRSIVNHLKGGLKRRMEELRNALLEYNKALHINHEPLDDPYVYIIGHEMRVRGCFDLVKNYMTRLF